MFSSRPVVYLNLLNIGLNDTGIVDIFKYRSLATVITAYFSVAWQMQYNRYIITIILNKKVRQLFKGEQMLFKLSNPVESFFSVQKAMESAHERGYFGSGFSSSNSFPSIDVFEEENNTVLTAEIPGTQKENIKLEVKDNTIRVYGERKVVYPEKADIRRLERKNMKYDRTIELKAKVEANKVTANYENGILKIIIPKAESEQSKQVHVS